jgi:hypothetical protein
MGKQWYNNFKFKNMNTLFSKIIVLVVFVGSFHSYAQFRNNGNQGPGGVDRSIGSSQRYNNPPRKAEAIDYVKITVDKLTEKMTLDGFQSAILKNILEDYKKVTTAIGEEDIPNEAKFEKIKSEKIKMDDRIKEILNEKQKIIFEDLKDSKSDTKKKKNKKKQTNAEDTENELF